MIIENKDVFDLLKEKSEEQYNSLIKENEFYEFQKYDLYISLGLTNEKNVIRHKHSLRIKNYLEMYEKYKQNGYILITSSFFNHIMPDGLRSKISEYHYLLPEDIFEKISNYLSKIQHKSDLRFFLYDENILIFDYINLDDDLFSNYVVPIATLKKEL